MFEHIAKILDLNLTATNRITHGEPQMSKYGELYSPISGTQANEQLMALKWLIHYADGEHDLLSIAEMSGIGVEVLNGVARDLTTTGFFHE